MIQLYATPRQHTSFGWHYDAEEVFIVQAFGTKRYLLRENTVRPSPLLDAILEDMDFEKETSPVMRCDLTAGNRLYVPSGFWHVARAETDSMSISIGVAAPTVMDLFDELRKHFAESAVWRQRLSPIGPHPDLAAILSQESARTSAIHRCSNERSTRSDGSTRGEAVQRDLTVPTPSSDANANVSRPRLRIVAQPE